MGAFRWICWWQLRQDFIGGGCCWYRKGGGFGRGAIDPWFPNWGFDKPRFPNIGECWPAIEKKGFCCGGGRERVELQIDFSDSLMGIGHGSDKDLSFSRTPADFKRSFSSSDISGSFSKSRRSVLILLTSCLSGTYSDKSFLALSWNKEKLMPCLPICHPTQKRNFTSRKICKIHDRGTSRCHTETSVSNV